MEFINNIHIDKRNRISDIIKDIHHNPFNYSLDGVLRFFKIIFKNDFKKYIKIYNDPNFKFPSNEIEKIVFDKQKIIIYTNRFGVTHIDNNIANSAIEEFSFIEFSNQIDTNISDFINIFNNKLLHLSFQIASKFSPSLTSVHFLESYYGKIINSLSGEVFSKFENMNYNSIHLLWANKRTNHNLQMLLKNLMNCNVRISEPKGGFSEIKENLFSLGLRNNSLSRNAYIGKYVFNPTKYLDIFIEVKFNYLLYFIHEKLASIFNFIKSYLHFVIDFKIKLLISKQSIEPLDLQSNKIFLGLNSFLTAKNSESFDNEVYLSENIINQFVNFRK